MQSPVVNSPRWREGRCSRGGRGRSAGITLSLCLALLSVSAQATEEQECSAAYDKLQVLRREGKFLAAREQVAICMRDACAAFIRADASKWFAELQARQPSVLLDVQDEAGK